MSKLRVLLMCECSGAIRSRLRARGIDAWSVDLKPAEDGSPHHIVGDALEVGRRHGWTAAIAHPTCTYLTSAAEWAYGDGPYHQKVRLGTLTGAARRAARDDAIRFALDLWSLPIPHFALENPVGVLSRVLGKPQTVQPYQFGDDASKRTCWWLRGLPKLRPTGMVEPRVVDGKPRWANQTDSGQNRLSPGEDRATDRSRTYPGMADAIAAQWGDYLLSLADADRGSARRVSA
jgi:hypothetical protein